MWLGRTPATSATGPRTAKAWCANCAKGVDVLLVAGASNGSNSNRLREFGADSAFPGYLIAYGSELRPEWVRGARTVGITTGASAPETLVENVIDALARPEPVDISTMTGRIKDIEFKLPALLADSRPLRLADHGNSGERATL